MAESVLPSQFLLTRQHDSVWKRARVRTRVRVVPRRPLPKSRSRRSTRATATSRRWGTARRRAGAPRVLPVTSPSPGGGRAWGSCRVVPRRREVAVACVLRRLRD